MPSLTAIVPATDSPAMLPDCLAAIENAENRPEGVLIIEEPRRSGPANARNIGARRACGDILVFVDADVAVHGDAFIRIRGAFDADPALTALFGSYDDAPRDAGLVSGFRNLLHHHVHQAAAGPATTFWAGLGAVRRDVFLDAGGFDEERFPSPSIEDVELGMRLFDRGARIELDAALLGTHLKAWSLPQMLRSDLLARGVPWVVLLLRRRRPSTALNLGWRHRVSVGAALGVAAALVSARPLRAACPLGAVLLLNRRFYALLWRRRGPLAAGAGVPLHLLHHLVSAAALALGALAYARERWTAPSR